MTGHGPLQMAGSPRGLALTGPGGTVLLSAEMLAHVAEFAIALQDLFLADPDAEEHDPAEDGDGGGEECTDDEPGFDRKSRAIVNRYGEGAGCAINGDAELNGDELDYSE